MTVATTLIQGHLGQDALPELLQFICTMDRVGQLVVERPRPRMSAAVYIDHGRVIHACLPPFEGEEALLALLHWREGRYAFLAGARPERVTIISELHPLLIEGMRCIDELRRLLARLPPPDAVLYPEHDAQAVASVLLDRRQWRLCDAADGLRTVADLLRIAGPDELRAAQDLALLLDQGLLRTTADEHFLPAIVPAATGSRELAAACPDLTRLDLEVLQLADGRRSLADLAFTGGVDGQAVIASCRRLTAANLMRIASGVGEFERYVR